MVRVRVRAMIVGAERVRGSWSVVVKHVRVGGGQWSSEEEAKR